MNTKKILVPVTLSAGSRAAIAVAAKLAQERDETIVLLHVVPGEPSGKVQTELAEQPAKDPFQQAEQKLHELARDARIAGPVEFVVCAGDVVESILDQARRKAADAIVMCTHGYGGWLRWLHRRRALKVLERAACPVWLIAPGENNYAVELRVAGCRDADRDRPAA